MGTEQTKENVKAPVENTVYPSGYIPNDDEEYMSPMQLAYFKDKLLEWKSQLEKEVLGTVEDLQKNSSIEPDLNDQASLEYEQGVELRARDRERKLINKIEQALDRIANDDDFGYCEETGDPIGVRRLMARPIATLCIEAKRRQEKQETGYAG